MGACFSRLLRSVENWRVGPWSCFHPWRGVKTHTPRDITANDVRGCVEREREGGVHGPLGPPWVGVSPYLGISVTRGVVCYSMEKWAVDRDSAVLAPLLLQVSSHAVLSLRIFLYIFCCCYFVHTLVGTHAPIDFTPLLKRRHPGPAWRRRP